MHPHSHNIHPGLLELRRQLEEILAMVRGNANGNANSENDRAESIRLNDDIIASEPDLASTETEDELSPEPAANEPDQPHRSDDLFDNALVVVTEFGQASPAILQMWLSIDYGRALEIFNRFQADGLVSSKGKVRHKAFMLRRSLDQQV